MPSDRFESTMHDWLADRGAGRAPDRLHAHAMTAVGGRRQRVRLWATLRAGITDTPTIGGLQAGTAARPFAVLVLTLLVGLALGFAVGSRPAVLPIPTQSPQPTPEPSPTPSTVSAPVETETFVKPFTYQLLNDSPEFQLVMEEDGIAGFGYGTRPAAGGAYGSFQRELVRGVAVMAVGSPWIHACDVSSVGSDASEFLELLTNAMPPEPVASTTFDGRPALTTSFLSRRNSCSGEVHYDDGPARNGEFINITMASQMTLFEVGDQTIVVDIWARDDAEFDAWLPEATQFVESIHFVEAPYATESFIEPFEYSMLFRRTQWIHGHAGVVRVRGLARRLAAARRLWSAARKLAAGELPSSTWTSSGCRSAASRCRHLSTGQQPTTSSDA